MELDTLNIGTPVSLDPLSANDLMTLFEDDFGLVKDPGCTLCSYTCSSATASTR